MYVGADSALLQLQCVTVQQLQWLALCVLEEAHASPYFPPVGSCQVIVERQLVCGN